MIFRGFKARMMPHCPLSLSKGGIKNMKIIRITRKAKQKTAGQARDEDGKHKEQSLVSRLLTSKNTKTQKRL